MNKKITAASAALALAALVLTGCSGPSENYTERVEKQNTKTLENSLGIANQEERLQREEDPNAIRYTYIVALGTGSVLGYYTIAGKVSSAGTQLAPEQEIVDPALRRTARRSWTRRRTTARTDPRTLASSSSRPRGSSSRWTVSATSSPTRRSRSTATPRV